MKKDDECKKTPIEFEAPVEEETVEEETEQQDVIESDINGLQQEIENLRNSIEETQNGYLRVMADFDNYRKRQRDEVARLTGLVREDLITKLLPLMDNFDRTLLAAEAEHSYESLVEGVTLALKQTRDMLAMEGLEPIEAVGRQFDPELHEALMREVTNEYEENTIISEVEKGYTLNGKVLRPSRVTVAVKP
ncbi:MAG: nucleotide exchange factor GrpE [Armatimonadota bacterium]